MSSSFGVLTAAGGRVFAGTPSLGHLTAGAALAFQSLRSIASMDGPERERRERMTEVQGRSTGALNIERIYQTTVSADVLAKTLADHFRAQEFEAQVYSTSGDRTVMQARKESLWRQLL